MCQTPGANWISSQNFMVPEMPSDQGTYHRQAHIKEAYICVCVPDTLQASGGQKLIYSSLIPHRRAEQSLTYDGRC